MSSSRQLAIVASEQEHMLDDIFQTVQSDIQTVRIAKIDNIQSRNTNTKHIWKENLFARTRIEFPVTSSVPTTPAAKPNSSYIKYSHYVQDEEYVLLDIVRGHEDADKEKKKKKDTAIGFVRAGPRAKVLGGSRRAAIVSSGSLCPGLNEVVAELFNCLYYNYGLDTIFGIRGGFSGFYDKDAQPWQKLTPAFVHDASSRGGSILGFRKGGFDAERMLNACEMYGVNHLFLIGGDGTHMSAHALDMAAKARGSSLTIACVPNSLENDLGVIDASFGFDTAVSVAVRAIDSAATESACSPDGVGVVQLTGEHAGHLAAHATLAAGKVDLCIVPESPFKLDGEDGILRYVEKVVARKGHAVVVVAEGAGGDVIQGRWRQGHTESPGVVDHAIDPTTTVGNDMPGMRHSMGAFMRMHIERHFKSRGRRPNIKYVEPSYMIRCVRASAADNVHCLSLSHNAVHAALAGYTGFSSAIVNNRSVLIPIPLIVRASPSRLSLKGRTWERVLSNTQQPSYHDYDEETATALEMFVAQGQSKL